MHSIYSNLTVIRILSQTQRIKWRSPQNSGLPHKREIKNPLCCSLSRIICTDSRLQGGLCCQVHVIEEKCSEHESAYHYERFLKENFKINDNRFFKLITEPNECNHMNELLWTKEFKDVLSRSSFYYDVNLAENTKHYILPISDVHPQPLVDVYNSSSFSFGKQSIGGLDQVFCSSNSSKVGNDSGRPTEEQLLHVINSLTYSLLNFFEKPHDYSIYHKNVIFQNNIKGVTTRGITAYIQKLYLLKLYGKLHYAKVKIEILKITHHVQDGTVRVRWRINGVSRHKVFFLFWRLKSVSWNQFVQEESEWLDGFSVFSVGLDGLIYKHVCDKMIPDDDFSVSKQIDLKNRLLGLLGLPTRSPAAGSLNTLIACYKSQELLSCKKLT